MIRSDGIFKLYQITIIDSFSCIPFLGQWYLHVSLNVLFYLFYAKFTVMGSFSLAPKNNIEVKTFGGNKQKTDVITSKRHPDIMHESRVTASA